MVFLLEIMVPSVRMVQETGEDYGRVYLVIECPAVPQLVTFSNNIRVVKRGGRSLVTASCLRPSHTQSL